MKNENTRDLVVDINLYKQEKQSKKKIDFFEEFQINSDNEKLYEELRTKKREEKKWE